jgi:hypothetical protein
MSFILKRTLGRVRKAGVCTILAGALLSPLRGNASSFYYHFDSVSSGTSPVGSGPFVNALFTDITPGVVQLTISAVGLSGPEFLSALDLNLNPALSPADLSFSVVGSTGSFADPTISTGANKFKADGGGKYDVSFVFNSKAAKSFGAGDSVTYDICYTGGTLTANDFDFLSKPAAGSDPLLAIAQVSGIPGCDSPMTGWVDPCQITPVPEPGPVALLALAAGLWAGTRRFLGRAKRV